MSADFFLFVLSSFIYGLPTSGSSSDAEWLLMGARLDICLHLFYSHLCDLTNKHTLLQSPVHSGIVFLFI